MARVGSLTRLDLRWMLAQRLGEHLVSTSTANGNLTTLFDSKRWEETGAFVGGWLYIPTGTVSGFSARVVTFVPGSFIAFQPASTVSIPSGTLWEWHPKQVGVYDDMLRNAERKGLFRTWIDDRDESVTWIGDTWEYSLAGVTLDLLAEVRMQYTGSRWYELRGPLEGGQMPQWRIERDESTPRLVFERDLVNQLPSGTAIRLIGQRRPLIMTTDAETCELTPATWVIEEALAEIHDAYSRARDTRGHAARGDRALQRGALEGLEMVPALPGSVPIRQYQR